MFSEKDYLRRFTKFIGKHPCQSLFFNKIAGLRIAILRKKRLWQSCFPVNFANFLKTLFFKEPLRGLLLYLVFFSHQLVDTINNFEVILATREKE